ncbi:MAG: anaerobic ribonucleoside-triphosphate reductase [Bacillota bacterium]
MGKNELKITHENAADRMTYVGEVYSVGEKKVKEDLLNALPEEWSRLHKNGNIHIHDLDAYGRTYNCLAFQLDDFFPYTRFENHSANGKIISIFDFIKELLSKLGNEQSGGMAFANFDNDIANTINKLNVDDNDVDEDILRTCIKSFIIWCNNSHERMGKVSYYVSLNVGLAKNALARKICYLLLDEFEKTDATIFKPNIIFKLNKKINSNKDSVNYDLYNKALKVTTKKMIPTYVFSDTKPNKSVAPEKLVIMGCRTRVVDDKYGEKRSIGRGNIAYVSINLPRIALMLKEKHNISLDSYLEEWDSVAKTVSEILEDRYYKLVNNRTTKDFRLNQQYKMWMKSFTENDLDNIFKHGTLSIGYIGLSEAVEILTDNKYYENDKSYTIAYKIVEHMKHFVDNLTDSTRFNYSLLASSGELISGRFTKIDKNKGYKHKVIDKGFYTNSFHVNVDSKVSTFKKIELEGPFHIFNSGGCITYLELKEAPINNETALKELINHAYTSGIHYLGFNFDLDICKQCSTRGVFDECPSCKSKEIIRIRRVSGYLEIVDYFTYGKQNEVKKRLLNKVDLCTYQ